MFFSNQEEIFLSITNNIEENSCSSYLIEGRSGTGKTYVLSAVEYHFEKSSQFRVLFLRGDKYCVDREYYPFTNMLNDMVLREPGRLRKNVLSESMKSAAPDMAKSIPILGQLISSITKEGVSVHKRINTLKYASLSDRERDIMFQIDSIRVNRPVLFICDDLQYWDELSLSMLYQVLKNIRKGQIAGFGFVGAYTPNNTRNDLLILESVKSVAKMFHLLPLTKEEFPDVLLSLVNVPTPLHDQIDTLYSITQGHLQLTVDVSRFIVSNSENDISQIIQHEDVTQIIEENLHELGADGNAVEEMLKFAALIGQTFSAVELQYALNTSYYEIRALIHQANGLYLVNETEKGASFVHEIIRELFLRKSDKNAAHYYRIIADALKLVHPVDYSSRSRSLLKAGMLTEACEIMVLELISNCRNGLNADKILKEILALTKNELLMEYIYKIMDAYTEYYSERYENCLNILESIEDIYKSPLLAEKYYLMSITYSKYLHSSSRKEAIACLSGYSSLESVDNETDIYQRVLSALLAAYIHENMYNEAKITEKLLMSEYTKRISYDSGSVYNLNILRRKSSAIHSASTALTYIEKAVAFFGPKDKERKAWPLNMKEYYMALTNYVAMLLLTGKYGKAYIYADVLINLPNNYPDTVFQRIEMPINNYVLAAFFSRRITPEQAGDYMDALAAHQNLRDVERISIQCNSAIFHALSGRANEAKSILYRQAEIIAEHKTIEIYYDYLVHSNLACLEYLEGNTEKGLSLLKPLCCNELVNNDFYLAARTKKINELMSARSEFKSVMDWFENSLIMTRIDDTWDYYCKGFLFGELEFWSES